MSSNPLAFALDPRSIAVIGASENPNKIGGRPLAYLRRFGFKGQVFPINPTRAEVQGYRCYPDLTSVPEVPDMAIVVVAGDNAVAAVEACAKLGVKIAVVMASGFGETGLAEGKAKERHMVTVARAHGMRIVGPNSQGLANFGTGAIASFSTMFVEQEPADGPVAIVGQSGAMTVVPFGLLRRRGIGVRHTHATGNDADITVGELACAVASDPAVKLLLLYLESIPDPRPFIDVARIAAERDLAVIVLKAGRTAAGAKAAASHTGALANEDRVVDAFIERHGFYRARDVGGLVDAAALYLKGWKPTGRRLVAVSNSGATCVLTADAASDHAMPMAVLKDDTRSQLAKALPSFATTTNPVDLTAALLGNSRLFSDILPILAKDPAADCFVIGIPVAGQGYDVEAFARDTAHFAQSTGKPTVVVTPMPSVAATFMSANLPIFDLESQAVAALSQFITHKERMAAVKARGIAHLPQQPGIANLKWRTLNEADSLALLARNHVDVVDHRLCRTEADALAAWEALGRGSVVVKGCSAEITHKSELGLVRLKLATASAVTRAFNDMAQIIANENARFDGVIVAQMATGLRELMIGAHRDRVFGPIVMIGDGGKYVEAMPDVAILLPPFSADDVRDALARLRIAPLLSGVRGEPPLDIAAYCDAVLAVGNLMKRSDPFVQSLDLNPVLLRPRGQGYTVVDAVAIVA